MAWTTVATEDFEDASWLRPVWAETNLNPPFEDFEANVGIKYGTGKLYGDGWLYGQTINSDWQPITWAETSLLVEDFEAMDW